MGEIIYKDISELKEFKKFGDVYKQVECFGDNIYLYSRENVDPDCESNGVYVYELVRGVPHKNRDGQIVISYPGSRLWGAYGKTIWKSTSREALLKEVEKMRPKK